MKMQLVAAFALVLIAGVASAATSNTSADAMFANKAAQGNLAEIAMGHIALDNGTSEGVKQFGQRLVDDHGKANEALHDAADKADMELPDSPSQKQLDAATKLKAMAGMQFDEHFAQMMVKDHNEAITMYREEANTGKNADLRAYAKSTLPVLEAHLKLAKQLAHPGH